MRLTTLCYTENNGRWLMMHRVKKSEDENAGKWIGLGGHLQDGESPEECVRREVREEAGLELSDLRLRGIITFILPDCTSPAGKDISPAWRFLLPGCRR